MPHDRSFRAGKFFHGFRHESPFQKGDLKYIILDLLKNKPMYGYEIILALEEQSHGFYKPSPGVVYPTLQMLEEMGYTTAIDRDGKKIYTITEAGRQWLQERSELADEVKSHMRHHWNHGNFGALGEIFSELAKLGRTVGPRIHDVEPEKMKRIREIVSRARRDIEAILGE